MKLSEKIQEALGEQLEISLSDPAVQRRLAAQWGYVPAGEQVAPVVKDERATFREWFEGEQGVAYDGLWSFARAAWLARAALGAPSVPREAIEKMLTQLMDIAVSNGANSVSMPDEYVEVAAWLCGIPAQPASSVPDATWLPVPDKHPTFYHVDLLLADGSVLCDCLPQSDGDYWWKGPSGEVFIDPRYAPVTHWRLSATPEAKP